MNVCCSHSWSFLGNIKQILLFEHRPTLFSSYIRSLYLIFGGILFSSSLFPRNIKQKPLFDPQWYVYLSCSESLLEHFKFINCQFMFFFLFIILICHRKSVFSCFDIHCFSNFNYNNCKTLFI